jgi:hypothetical protein
MVKVCVEVREGAALFRATVQAESISRAVSIMKVCRPGGDVRVVFPIDPGEFFAGGPNEAGGDGSSRMRPLPCRIEKTRVNIMNEPLSIASRGASEDD